MYKECTDKVGGRLIRFITDEDSGGCWINVRLSYDKDLLPGNGYTFTKAMMKEMED